LTATPAFFINGRFLSGAVVADVTRVVEEELTHAEGEVRAGRATATTYYERMVLARGLRSNAIIATENAKVEGELDLSAVLFAFERSTYGLRDCYQRRLLVDPMAIGKVQTTFLVETDGRLVEVKANGIDADVAGCLIAVLRRVTVTKGPKRATPVSVVFAFRPGP
jgi:hypothetical protein